MHDQTKRVRAASAAAAGCHRKKARTRKRTDLRVIRGDRRRHQSIPNREFVVPPEPSAPGGDTDDPQDCVRQFPMLDALEDPIELVGFDLHGVARIKIDVARRDAAHFEEIILRYVRERFGQIPPQPIFTLA